MTKENHSNSIAVVTIIVLVLVVIGLLIYFFGFHSSSNTDRTIESPTFIEKPSIPIPAPQYDESK